MSIATTIRGIVVDIRAEGLEYLIDETFPVPVRHQIALTTALGACCIAEEAAMDGQGDMRWHEREERIRRIGALKTRVHAALKSVDAWGKTTRWASWFERWS